jgi:hypothetical protein
LGWPPTTGRKGWESGAAPARRADAADMGALSKVEQHL